MDTKHISFAIFAIILGFFTLQSYTTKKNEEFKRNFDSIVKIEKNNQIYNNKKTRFLNFTTSDKNIVFVKEKYATLEESNYELTFLDQIKLKEVKTIEANLPKHASILFATDKKIYYRDKLEVYEYDINAGCLSTLTKEGVRIFGLYPLANNKVLCIGNVLNPQSKKNIYSFFTLDLGTTKIEKIEKELWSTEDDQSLENSLRFTGKFIVTGNKIAYVFDKYGKIEIFDKQGKLLKEIETIDKVQPAEITFFNDIYTYKRGSTFYSNSGAIIIKNQLFVFSCRPSNPGFIMVDIYDIGNGAYQSSYKLHYDQKKSNDIGFVYHTTPSSFVIGFDNSYQSFTTEL